MLEGCPAVMICGFNRPTCLKRVFDSVRKVAPRKLFLVLDYPRVGREDDVVGWKKCKAIFDGVDWPCEVHRNYADSNMGCGKRMVSGIDWVFKHVESAIILEDDCVPCESFYRFCGELLERYKDDSRIGMIAGYAGHFHQAKVKTYGWSYFFDRTCTIWGWATWRRMWEKHDPTLADWEFFRDSGIMRDSFFRHTRHYETWKRNIQNIYEGRKNVWAAAWGFTMLKNHCLCVHPVRNMVENVGEVSSRDEAFGRKPPSDDRHGRQSHYGRATHEMDFPLVHPLTFLPILDNEYWYYEDVYRKAWWRLIPNLPQRVFNKILRTIGVR